MILAQEMSEKTNASMGIEAPAVQRLSAARFSWKKTPLWYSRSPSLHEGGAEPLRSTTPAESAMNINH
jgi:hypothetical protein